MQKLQEVNIEDRLTLSKITCIILIPCYFYCWVQNGACFWAHSPCQTKCHMSSTRNGIGRKNENWMCDFSHVTCENNPLTSSSKPLLCHYQVKLRPCHRMGVIIFTWQRFEVGHASHHPCHCRVNCSHACIHFKNVIRKICHLGTRRERERGPLLVLQIIKGNMVVAVVEWSETRRIQNSLNDFLCHPLTR